MARSEFPGNRIGAAAVFLLALTAVSRAAEDAPKVQGPRHYPAEMNKKFSDPKADIGQFVDRFENEARNIYVKRQSIVRTVGLRPGDAVADIGAGTGLFTQLFADQVGPKGAVYAVDIGPAFIKYIDQQAKKLGHEKTVKTVLNTQESTKLPAGSIDVAFICDTYHHFDHPEKMLASIHRALRSGGRLIIVDFDLRKDSSDFVKQRARARRKSTTGRLPRPASSGSVSRIHLRSRTTSMPSIGGSSAKGIFNPQLLRISRQPAANALASLRVAFITAAVGRNL